LTVFPVSVPKPFISTVQQLNIADTSKKISDVSSEVDTSSACLSTIETKADTGSVATIQTSRLTFSIYKYCCTATKEEKDYTKKIYFCKYCPLQDRKRYYTSTARLQYYFKKYNIE
jgi:hypothetical protein